MICGQIQSDGPEHCKDASPTYSSLKNLYFGPHYHFTKSGHGVFLHPV